jgi:PAS domain S-box-containing protein
MVFWASTVVASLLWNLNDHEKNTDRILIDRGRSLFEMVLVHRQWNSEHGGVYVPLTDSSLPNQYLIDPLREVTCTAGLELTKVNPAYMTRQLSELATSEDIVHFHITSLSPIRPGNEPDDWETEALRSFEQGSREEFELIKGDGNGDNYRYMAPLYTEKSCLRCHAEQGYRVGDVRGGISVSFDAEEIEDAAGQHMSHMVIVHGLALLIGFVFISWFAGYSRKADRKLEDERRRFQDLVELTGAVHWEVDISTLRFTYISPKVEALLGYPASDWKDFDFWVSTLHPEDRQWAPAYCNEQTAMSQDHIFTYRALAADGREVWIRDIVNVVTDESGRPVKLRGLFIDDTEIKKAEAKLKQSLTEKEVLLKEVHHRVKNNMAVIVSLQSLQAKDLEDGLAKEALAENMRRIRSMALVHEMIYQSDDVASIDVSDYMERLALYVSGIYQFPKDGLSLDVDFRGACQDLDMLIPLGLISNELISNAMKHAFDDYSGANITISLSRDENGEVGLAVEDNGRGLPEGMTLESAGTLGLKLVKALVEQIDGSLDIRREGGTAFHIRFTSKHKA